MAKDHDDDAANDGVASLQGAAFGRYLEGLRNERGLSREEFSARSGLSVATIRRIEKGQTTALSENVILCF